jgi:ADP-ribose pyrophosphatase YjhB (NUDIX family)
MKTYCTVHVIATHNNKFLVLQRAKDRSHPGSWNCITGFIEEREAAEDAAPRELKEERNLEGKLIRTAEPYWKDSPEKRWIVVPSLVEVDNVGDLDIDEIESQDYKWIEYDDEIVKDSEALKTSLKQLELI